jgi:ABC-type antimicrobial peptide transport system permease subunit
LVMLLIGPAIIFGYLRLGRWLMRPVTQFADNMVALGAVIIGVVTIAAITLTVERRARRRQQHANQEH